MRNHDARLRAPCLLVFSTLFSLGVTGLDAYASPFSSFNVPGAGPLGTYVAGVSGSNLVGYYFDSQGAQHSFEYGAGAFTSINDPNGGPTSTVALGIDGSNVVGNFTDANDVEHGFIFDGAEYKTLDVTIAGSSPVTATSITGISGSNIVGTYTAGSEHGFLYNGSSFTTLDGPTGVSGANETELGTYPAAVYGNTVVGWTCSVTPGNDYFYQGYVYTSGTFTPTQLPGPYARTTHLTGVGADGIVGWDGGADESNPPVPLLISGTHNFALGEDLDWAQIEVYFEPTGISGDTVVGNTALTPALGHTSGCIVTAPGATNPIADPSDEFAGVTLGGTITEAPANHRKVKLPLTEKVLLRILGVKVNAAEVRFYYDKTNARIILGSVAHTTGTTPGAQVPVTVYGSLFSYWLGPLGGFNLGGGWCTAINDAFYGTYSGSPETVRNVIHNHVSFRVSATINGVATTIDGSFKEAHAL